MNIFKTGKFTWWQVGFLKLAVLSIGVAIGANWPELFVQHTLFLVVLGIVLGIYLATVWYKKG